MAGFEIVRNSNKEKEDIVSQTRTACAFVLPVYVLLFAVFATYFSVFEIKDKVPQVYILLFAAVCISYIITVAIKWNRKVLISMIVIMALLCLFGRNFILNDIVPFFYNGITPFVNEYIKLSNTYYFKNVPTIDAIPERIEISTVIFLIQIIFAIILMSVLNKRKGGILTVAVVLFPIILACTIGKLPSAVECWGLLATGSVYIICYRRKEGDVPIKEFVGAGGILLVLFVASLIIQPQINEYKEAHDVEYKEIREELIEAQKINVSDIISNLTSGKSNYTKGGIGKGKLKGISEFSPSGTNEMEVTVTEYPSESIYLRAFVGVNYTSGEWKELKVNEYANRISSILNDNAGMYSIWEAEGFLNNIASSDGEDKRHELMNYPFNKMGEVKKRHISIKILNASKEYGYAPYYAQIPEDEDIYLDAYVKGGGKKEHEYDYYARNVFDYMSFLEPEGDSDLWMAYKNFVWQKYIQSPVDLTRLSAACSTFNKDSTDNVYEEINKLYSKIMLTYNTAPGAVPDDEDFVEYFLYNNKKGFCVHFATTAVLMYRVCGYPARYVEGYVISPDAFEKQSDGTYKAIVTDAMAHAWCETFESDTGWKVREHTVRYQAAEKGLGNIEYTSPMQATNPITEPSTQRVDETESITKKPDETTSNQVNSNKNNNVTGNGVSNNKKGNDIIKNIVVKVFTVLFIMLISILLFVLQRKLRIKKKLRGFHLNKDNRAISNMYSEIYDICVFNGMTAKKQSDFENMEQMKKLYPQLTPGQWEWMYKLAEKAAFADEIIEREDRVKMYGIYKKFRKEILKELKGVKKIWFLYVKAM